nr:sodium-dependent phosphate transport protein 2B-like [Dermacentor andersoni]
MTAMQSPRRHCDLESVPTGQNYLTTVPLFIARRLGETGAKYRWFVLFYLLLMFCVIPLAALLLSLLGDLPFSIITVVVIAGVILTTLINVLQDKWPDLLPVLLQNWDFLPQWMHSLAPIDRFFKRHLERVPFCQVFLNEMSFISEPHANLPVEGLNDSP